MVTVKKIMQDSGFNLKEQIIIMSSFSQKRKFFTENATLRLPTPVGGASPWSYNAKLHWHAFCFLIFKVPTTPPFVAPFSNFTMSF
jgi:hypothetical protein